MRETINLINLKTSDVKYELTVFPDGEPHIKLDELDRKKEYKVICRITNPSELFVLAQVGHILKRQGIIFDVVITYLMSMRMDRVINFNEAFSLEIVASIINSFNPETVYVFEAHSDRVFKEIKNSKPINLINSSKVPFILNSNNTAICFPDYGAFDRYSYSSLIPPSADILCMKKIRDLENKGAIKSMELVNPVDKNFRTITIIDDLCDGGGTFCWASKILREKYTYAKVNIFVKHLVNPLGLKRLAETFDEVYITNSYKDWDVSEYQNVHLFTVA